MLLVRASLRQECCLSFDVTAAPTAEFDYGPSRDELVYARPLNDPQIRTSSANRDSAPILSLVCERETRRSPTNARAHRATYRDQRTGLRSRQRRQQLEHLVVIGTNAEMVLQEQLCGLSCSCLRMSEVHETSPRSQAFR